MIDTYSDGNIMIIKLQDFNRHPERIKRRLIRKAKRTVVTGLKALLQDYEPFETDVVDIKYQIVFRREVEDECK